MCFFATDAHIRIYNTANGNFKLMKRIRAKDVGWSVVDTAFRLVFNFTFSWGVFFVTRDVTIIVMYYCEN